MATPPDQSSPISSDQPLTQGRPTPTKTPEGFESHMQGAEGTQKGAGTTQGPSPAEIPQGPQAPQQGTPSLHSLTAQVGTAQDSLGNVQNQLNTKDLRLTNSQKHLLRNKLSNASTHLRAVNTKLGVDAPLMPAQTGKGPIAKFLNFVSDGENQLNAAKQQLQGLSKSGDNLRPADMMLIQIKMNQAQQEIEYSSTLLSKVISSLTQILNTQL